MRKIYDYVGLDLGSNWGSNNHIKVANAATGKLTKILTLYTNVYGFSMNV